MYGINDFPCVRKLNSIPRAVAASRVKKKKEEISFIVKLD